MVSPELIRLNNGLLVRLIGVRENKAINGIAINYIIEKTKGHRVYLRYDQQKHDSHNHLLCYVYLKNKTFLNAHLIKEGLADVDHSMEYKYKDKFINLETKHV